MDPIVAHPTERQLVYFPPVGTLGDFGDDGFGITKHKDDIWKRDTCGWKSDMVILLIYINNRGS